MFLVEGCFLLSEDVADEAVGGLFRGYVFFLAPSMVYQLKLALKRILHFHALPLLFHIVVFFLSVLFLLLALLHLIDDLMLKLAILPHLLVEYLPILVVHSLILLVFLCVFVAISVLLFQIRFILIEQLPFFLPLPSSLLLFVHQLQVQGADHVFSDRFCAFSLLQF